MRLVSEPAFNPVWSPDGEWIAYTGPSVAWWAPLRGVRLDGTPVELPETRLRQDRERYRFLPDGSGLVYMRGAEPWQDFWLLDMTSMETRPLTRFDNRADMRTFDISPDGERIVFDRLRANSDIVLIELPEL